MRRLLLFVMLYAGPLAGSAAAQPATDVRLTPIEIGTAISFVVDSPGSATAPHDVGAVVDVDRNFNDHVAIAAEVSTSARLKSLLAGPRLSTGFYRDGGGRIPGRFFAQALVGRRDAAATGSGTTFQIGAGADVLVVPRGVSLHWALDYFLASAPASGYAGARLSVGIVVGPHLAKS